MSRPELETQSLPAAPVRPGIEETVEAIVRDSADAANYVVDSLVPFGGE